MSDLFFGLTEHTATTLGAFVVFVLAVSMLLTRDRFPAFLGALAQAFLTVAVAPVRYLVVNVRDLPQEMADAEGPKGNKQYLLQQMHLVLSAFVLVLVVGVMSSFFATGWHAMVPSKAIREQYRDAVAERNTARDRVDELERLGPDPAELWRAPVAGGVLSDDLLQTRQVGLIAQDSMTALGESFEQATSTRLPEDVFGSLQALTSPAAIRAFVDEVQEDAEWALSSGASVYQQPQLGEIYEWVSQWGAYRLQYMAFAEAVGSELPEAQERLATWEDRVVASAEAKAWEQLPFLTSILAGLVAAILMVWFFGLILESVWLGVDVAANIRTIARATRPGTQSHGPTPTPSDSGE